MESSYVWAGDMQAACVAAAETMQQNLPQFKVRSCIECSCVHMQAALANSYLITRQRNVMMSMRGGYTIDGVDYS